ncbi:neuronal acetylcholine receptor subunit alpha-5-like isoform X2 [Belonocnema kinseyi]|uniref:neuronal acetylcholine receptor subunit alpha-5-like isoform X2 n=1 Tax=Belonocnema kinseyi TaxID=2817044 RepID=UPI00143D85F9|nr:neuronal acetylcholine receptor subunit alpha-5-like isoform X2 [Belonocnema kinseyi]
MTFFIFLLKFSKLILYFKLVSSESFSAEEPSTCKVFEPTLPYGRLKKHIFCNYEQEIRPREQHKNTTVNILLLPKLMEFEWNDDHLKWNPEDFDNMAALHVKSYEIWLPDLSVWNSADLNSDLIFSSIASCFVAHTGFVACIPFIKTTVHCSSDYENWPFEKQICQINLSSYFHYSDEVTLKVVQDKIMMDQYVPNQEWSIVSITATQVPGYIWPTVVYEFHLKRHAGIMFTLYVIPGIVLMMLTLVMLWMDVNSVDRISLGSVNFICHLFCLYDLHWQITASGRAIPYLLKFYQNSLALAVFSMVLTILLRNLQVVTTSSPNWISSLAVFVLRYRLGRLFILSDEEAKYFVEVEEETENNAESMQYVTIATKKEDTWKRFAKILECLSFFCVLVTYIVLLYTCIPKK